MTTQEADMPAGTAGFIQAGPGSTVDLTSTYEATWHQLEVLDLGEGDERVLSAAACQFLIFTLRGEGVVHWNGQELPLARGSALGVPHGEELTIRGSAAQLQVAVVTLSGDTDT